MIYFISMMYLSLMHVSMYDLGSFGDERTDKRILGLGL